VVCMRAVTLMIREICAGPKASTKVLAYMSQCFSQRKCFHFAFLVSHSQLNAKLKLKGY
jgi:hypothetical protein